MFPDLEFIKTCLNGLRSRIEKVENWVVSFVRVNRPNWAQNDPNALDYVKGRTHWEEEAVVDMSGKLYKITGFTSNTLTVTYDVIPLELGQVWSVQGGNDSAYTNVEVQRNADGVLYLGTLNVQPFYITKDTATINYSWFNSLKVDSLTLTCTSGSATIRSVHSLNPKFLPTPTSNAIGAIKADSAKTTDIQPVRLGTDGKLYSSGVPIFTTSGTGSAYTANVPEITELVNGMLVVMIPHVASASTAPTLNINGLGAYAIRRFLSTETTAINSPTGIYSNWLKPDVPVILMYNSGFWYACSFTKPDASDLWGTIPVSKGGIGRTTLTKGSYVVGNGPNAVQLKTPNKVLADIGAIPVPATAKVGQVVAVKAVDADGKPTEWEAVDMASGEDDAPVYLGTIPVSQDTVSYLVAPVKDYKKVVIVKERASQNNALTSYLYARLYQPETKKNFILAASNKTGYSFFVCKLECVSNDFVEGGMVYSNNATLTPAVSGMIPHSSVFSNSMINQNMPIDIDSYYYEFDVANASLAFDGNETVHVWGWKR